MLKEDVKKTLNEILDTCETDEKQCQAFIQQIYALLSEGMELRPFIERFEQIADQKHDFLQLAQAYNLYFWMFFSSMDVDHALEYNRRIAEYLDKIDKEKALSLECSMLNNDLAVYTAKGDLFNAYASAKKTAEIMKRRERYDDYASLLNNSVYIYCELGLYLRALEQVKIMLDQLKFVDSTVRHYYHYTACVVYLFAGEYQALYQLTEETLKEIEAGELNGEAKNLHLAILMSAYLKEGRMEDASSLYEKINEIYATDEGKDYLFYAALGRYAYQTHAWDEARKFYQLAYDSMGNMLGNRIDLLETIGRFYEEMGELTEAEKYYKQGLELSQKYTGFVDKILFSEEENQTIHLEKKSEESLYRRLYRITQLGQEISSCQDYVSLLQLIQQQMPTVLQCEDASLYLCSDGQVIRSTLGQEKIDNFAVFESEEGPFHKVMKGKRPLTINHVSEQLSEDDSLEFFRVNPEVKSLLLCPVLHHDKFLGILCLYSTSLMAFSNYDSRHLNVLMNYLGIGLSDIMRYQDVMNQMKLQEEESQRKIEVLNSERQNLEHLAERDSLTHLFNRAAAWSKINQYLQDTGDQGAGLLVLMDVDNFKHVNDSYGHPFADTVLSEIAGILQTYFRADDVVARIGGDEMMFFLKNLVSKEQGEERLNGLLGKLRTYFDQKTAEKEMSCSFGAALYPEDSKNMNQLYEKADLALYYSKEHGKGMFTIYGTVDISHVRHS